MNLPKSGSSSENVTKIRQRDDQVLRVLRNVGSDALPAGPAILATKMVIICRHPESP